MNLEKNAKLITCIFPRGKGLSILQSLYDQGVKRADMSFARGSDILSPVDSKGLLQIQEEKELLTVILDSPEKAEEIFDFIFENAEMNKMGGGLIYMSNLSHATAYSLPNIEEINKTRQKQPEA